MTTYLLRQENDRLTLINQDGNTLPVTALLDACSGKKVFALHGQMGAGKTTFLKQLCTEMGVQDTVNSPTFAIVNVYETLQGEELYHFDCYRLKHKAEAMDFGAEDYLYSGNYCFIEWPDVLQDLLPEDTVDIEISVLPNGDRSLRIL